MKPLDHSTNPRRRTNADVKIGENLRRIRLARGVTQERLAAALGMTFQNVQKIEKGQVRLALARAVDIADILDITIPDLLTGVEAGSRSDAVVPLAANGWRRSLNDLHAKITNQRQRTALRRLAEAMAETAA